MSDFYIFTNFVDAKDYSTASFHDKFQLKKYSNQPYGIKKNTWDESITLSINNKMQTADYFFCGPLIIVSKKLFNILDSYAKENLIEFLPIQLLFNHQRIKGYGVLNFTEEKDALDKSKSLISNEDGFPVVIKIALNESNIGDESIFYIQDSNHAIVVEKELRDKIINENIRGIAFKTPNEWRSF